MIRRSTVVWVLTLPFLLNLFGCAGGGNNSSEEFPHLTPEEVREIQNTQLQEFIDLVPVDQVTGIRGPLPAMAAWSCDTDLGGYRPFWREETGTYQLPGGSEVHVQDEMDVLAWFDEIATRQQALGWAVREDDVYREALWLYPSDGFVYVLTYFPEDDSGGASITIDSFSPCFIPPSELNLHEHY